MSRTASLILRIIALLAAIAAGVAWYLIYQLQIERAMELTKPLVTDERFSKKEDSAEAYAGNEGQPRKGDYTRTPKNQYLEVPAPAAEASEFVQRMERLPALFNIVKDMRKEIQSHIDTLKQRDATIAERDATIADQKNTIAGLEQDKTNLTRERDDLTGKLTAEKAKVATLEGEKEQLQKVIGSKDAEINKMRPKYEEYDSVLKARNDAQDELVFVTGRYTKLYRWAQGQTGLKPPFPSDPTDKKTQSLQGPRPKTITPPIPTKILTVDLRRGLLSLTLGKEEQVLKPGVIYNIETGGVPVGRIRIVEVLPGMTTADVLSGANTRLLVRGTVLNLTAAEGKVRGTQTDIAEAPISGAKAGAAPAAPAATGGAAPAPADIPAAVPAAEPPAAVPAAGGEDVPAPPPVIN
ncbi:MAG: hypothetical protein LBR07_09215 [Puniceicoccales bacterium]|jgi:hypothetical protein|nr:hypothetical protein [Puniceicoccales bacterium]